MLWFFAVIWLAHSKSPSVLILVVMLLAFVWFWNKTKIDTEEVLPVFKNIVLCLDALSGRESAVWQHFFLGSSFISSILVVVDAFSGIFHVEFLKKVIFGRIFIFENKFENWNVWNTNEINECRQDILKAFWSIAESQNIDNRLLWTTR